MHPGILLLSSVDTILEHNGYHVDVGTKHRLKPFLHQHNGIEIIFVHSGCAEAYSRTWRHMLRSGELIMNNAHIEHGAHGGFNRTVLYFLPDLIPLESRMRIADLLEETKCVHTALNPGSASRVMWACQELSSLMVQQGALLSVQALFGLVAAEIEVSLKQPGPMSSSTALQTVIEYMQANLNSEEKLEWLADRFNISASYLHHLFQTHFRCSPRQYWLSLKLDHACRLLMSEDQIQDISTAVGFQSLRGFQRAFRRSYHMSPSEYRASIRSQIH